MDLVPHINFSLSSRIDLFSICLLSMSTAEWTLGIWKRQEERNGWNQATQFGGSGWIRPLESMYWIVFCGCHEPMYSRNKGGRGRGSPDRKPTQVLTESSDTVPLLYSFSPLQMSCSLCKTVWQKFALGSFKLRDPSWPVSWHPPWPSYVLPSLHLWFLLSTEKKDGNISVYSIFKRH